MTSFPLDIRNVKSTSQWGFKLIVNGQWADEPEIIGCSRAIFRFAEYIIKVEPCCFDDHTQGLAEIAIYKKLAPVDRKYFIPIVQSGCFTHDKIPYVYVVQKFEILTTKPTDAQSIIIEEIAAKYGLYDVRCEGPEDEEIWNWGIDKTGTPRIYDYGSNKTKEAEQRRVLDAMFELE